MHEPLSEESRLPGGERRRKPGADAKPAIVVEKLSKRFLIPEKRIDTMKERIVRPRSVGSYRSLQALDSISFQIRQGEFFGIVGRNGSGKSTLLKLMASIYKADSGTIRMAGRLAPFIELGVGFNDEMTARENAVLNGVMMGLTPGESHDRLDAILDFAELQEFVDLKLKNYSSGMKVRLAFSVMTQADADILLIDEVLAVGDASFQQKCADVLHDMKMAGKTIVLVTHSMPTVDAYCDRAMLIEDGAILELGDPGAVARRYVQTNFEGGHPERSASATPPERPGEEASEEADAGEDADARVSIRRLWLEDGRGEEIENVERDEPIFLRGELQAEAELGAVAVGFIIANADGVGLTEFRKSVRGHGPENLLEQGSVIRLRATLRNPLVPGRYHIHCGVTEQRRGSILYRQRALSFVVYGRDHIGGVVDLIEDFETEAEGAVAP